MISGSIAASAALLSWRLLAKRRDAPHPDGVESGWNPTTVAFSNDTPDSVWSAFIVAFQALKWGYLNVFGQWRIADLLVGLRYLMRRDGDRHPAVDLDGVGTPIPAEEVREQIPLLLRFVSLMIAVRERRAADTLRSFARMGIAAEDVVVQSPVPRLMRPVLYVLRDHSTRLILVCIRGTYSMKDALTCMTGETTRARILRGDPRDRNAVFGYVHHGIHTAARHLKKALRETLRKEITETGYALRVVGHSLGAGTAVVLTSMLRDLASLHEDYVCFLDARCVAFACPACMTYELAEACESFCTTVVQGSDIIPTFCLASVVELRQEVMSSAWHEEFQKDVDGSPWLRALSRSVSSTIGAVGAVSSFTATVGAAVGGGTARAVRNVGRVFGRSRRDAVAGGGGEATEPVVAVAGAGAGVAGSTAAGVVEGAGAGATAMVEPTVGDQAAMHAVSVGVDGSMDEGRSEALAGQGIVHQGIGEVLGTSEGGGGCMGDRGESLGTTQTERGREASGRTHEGSEGRLTPDMGEWDSSDEERGGVGGGATGAVSGGVRVGSGASVGGAMGGHKSGTEAERPPAVGVRRYLSGAAWVLDPVFARMRRQAGSQGGDARQGGAESGTRAQEASESRDVNAAGRPGTVARAVGPLRSAGVAARGATSAWVGTVSERLVRGVTAIGRSARSFAGGPGAAKGGVGDAVGDAGVTTGGGVAVSAASYTGGSEGLVVTEVRGTLETGAAGEGGAEGAKPTGDAGVGGGQVGDGARPFGRAPRSALWRRRKANSSVGAFFEILGRAAERGSPAPSDHNLQGDLLRSLQELATSLGPSRAGSPGMGGRTPLSGHGGAPWRVPSWEGQGVDEGAGPAASVAPPAASDGPFVRESAHEAMAELAELLQGWAQPRTPGASVTANPLSEEDALDRFASPKSHEADDASEGWGEWEQGGMIAELLDETEGAEGAPSIAWGGRRRGRGEGGAAVGERSPMGAGQAQARSGGWERLGWVADDTRGGDAPGQETLTGAEVGAGTDVGVGEQGTGAEEGCAEEGYGTGGYGTGAVTGTDAAIARGEEVRAFLGRSSSSSSSSMSSFSSDSESESGSESEREREREREREGEGGGRERGSGWGDQAGPNGVVREDTGDRVAEDEAGPASLPRGDPGASSLSREGALPSPSHARPSGLRARAPPRLGRLSVAGHDLRDPVGAFTPTHAPHRHRHHHRHRSMSTMGHTHGSRSHPRGASDEESHPGTSHRAEGDALHASKHDLARKYQYYPAGCIWHLVPRHIIDSYRDYEDAKEGRPPRFAPRTSRYLARRVKPTLSRPASRIHPMHVDPDTHADYASPMEGSDEGGSPRHSVSTAAPEGWAGLQLSGMGGAVGGGGSLGGDRSSLEMDLNDAGMSAGFDGTDAETGREEGGVGGTGGAASGGSAGGEASRQASKGVNAAGQQSQDAASTVKDPPKRRWMLGFGRRGVAASGDGGAAAAAGAGAGAGAGGGRGPGDRGRGPQGRGAKPEGRAKADWRWVERCRDKRRWEAVKVDRSFYSKLRPFPKMMFEHYVVTYADALVSLAHQAGFPDAADQVVFGSMLRLRKPSWTMNPAIKYVRAAKAERLAHAARDMMRGSGDGGVDDMSGRRGAGAGGGASGSARQPRGKA